MKLKYIFSALAFLFLATLGYGQNEQQRKNIVQQTDVEALQSLAVFYQNMFERDMAEAAEYAKNHNIPLVIEKEDGSKSHLWKVDQNNQLIYITTTDKDGAITHNTNQLYLGGSVGVNLEGQGMVAGVWDGGKVRGSHELLNGQIEYKDNSSSFEDHATHVTGIVNGKKLLSGPGVEARGMANRAIVDAYDWNLDITEMSVAASQGLLISNHSYGLDLSQVDAPFFMGVYDDLSVMTDQIAYSAPYYTIVTSAGNDRAAGYTPTGYRILGGRMTTAKNSIVVAAVNKVTNYAGPSSVVMSNFSSWGPTNDNRIKPDISAFGVQVYSALAFQNGSGSTLSNNTYGNMNGTSMASPGVTGSLLLLQELSSDLNDGEFIKSATLKAIMIETAREAGSHPGPDPAFGWGLLNTAEAAELMIDHHNDGGSFYEEVTLSSSFQNYTKTIEAGRDGELKATIAWTDPNAAGQTSQSTQSVLVNDFDLRIEDSQGNVHYPWRLNPNNISGPALNDGDNAVDNVEQVLIPNAIKGETYTIKVTNKAIIFGNTTMDFSIAVYNPGVLSVNSEKHIDFSVYPNPASEVVHLMINEPAEKVEINITDMRGRSVVQQSVSSLNGAVFSVDVSNLDKGVYFMTVNSGAKRATEKLIVK